MNALLTMGLAGGVTLFLWELLNRVAGERLPAAWHTAFLRLSLFLTLIPVNRFPVWISGLRTAARPVTLAGTVPVMINAVPSVTIATPTAPLLSLSGTLLQALAILWAAGTIGLLVSRLRDYVRFRRMLGSSVPVQNPETLRVFAECRQGTKARLLRNPGVPTPLVTGLFRPVIILPDTQFSEAERKCLFLHELTHIRRYDLWTRFFAMLSQCLHWWNPAVAVLRRELRDWEERRCDEEVSRMLDGAERKSYGLTLLRLASASAIGGGWAASFSTGRILKERLERVIRPRTLTGRRARLAAVVLATAFLVCAGAVAAIRTPFVARSDNPNPTRSLTAQERLILRRGGTLLPDENPDAWSNARKLYIDRNGVPRIADRIGNADALPAVARRLLYELQDGDFPRNGKGESYGRQMMEDYVGYAPELRYVGTGYIDPAEFDAVPVNLPADECPHRFRIPLYDSEHRAIGEYAVSCDGHDPLSGVTVEEAKIIVGLAGEMQTQNWRSIDELREYLYQHWDNENRRMIP